MRLTEAQRVALEVTGTYGGDGAGWAECELQFLSRRTGNDYPIRLESGLCLRVWGALGRKGLVTTEADGPRLTRAGELMLRDIQEPTR